LPGKYVADDRDEHHQDCKEKYRQQTSYDTHELIRKPVQEAEERHSIDEVLEI
jgi:hypothetical protein